MPLHNLPAQTKPLPSLQNVPCSAAPPHGVRFPPAVLSKHHLLQSPGFLKARLQSRITSDAFPRLRVEGLPVALLSTPLMRPSSITRLAP